MCLGAVYWAHLDHIYFSHSKSDAKESKTRVCFWKEDIFENFFLVGFDDFFIYEELARELHERRVGITQLLKDESKAFSMWSESQKKTHY